MQLQGVNELLKARKVRSDEKLKIFCRHKKIIGQ